ncbi:MAG: filamentous hemagglutinin N-terminal domain-containing protein [Pseudomonadota bacterium]
MNKCYPEKARGYLVTDTGFGPIRTLKWPMSVLMAALSQPLLADVVTDGTVGDATALSGPNFMIPDSLGTRAGSNLFHSFSQFSLGSTESATFTSSFQGETHNVISRITGGAPSLIDGRLASTIPGADLWLINPSGVLFGSGSSLDLQGGLHVATASYVALQDGGRFGADISDPSNTLLTTAPVSAFGFLDSPQPITVNGQLELAEGQALTFTAGEISIGGQLETPSGRVSLVALGSPGELAVATGGGVDDASLNSFTALADVDISNTNGNLARIRSNGASPGSIYIRGNSFMLDGLVASIANELDTDDAQINIAARERIAIGTRSPDSFLASAVLGGAEGADVRLAAPNVTIAETAVVTAFVDSSAQGNGGNVAVAVDQLSVAGNLSTATNGNGDAGDISISGYTAEQAQTVLVSGDEAFISADSGVLSASTEGDAGHVTIATQSLLIDTNNGGVFADAQTASAGTITLSVDEFFLRQGTVSASVVPDGSGEAGSVEIRGLDSRTDTVASAGLVSITRGDGATLNGARAPANITSSGAGGSVTVTADRVEVLDGGLISIVNLDQVGAPGAITLNVNQLDVGALDSGSPADPSLITTATSGAGDAGSIVIRGVGSTDANVLPSVRVSLSDEFGGLSADSFSRESNAGASGDIILHSENLLIQNGAGIGSTNAGGTPGSVTLHVDSLEVTGAGAISTLTVGSAAAGDINIRGLTNGESAVAPARDVLFTEGSTIGGNPIGETGGAGGTITIRAENLTVSEGARVDVGGFSRTSAGGNVLLLADVVRIDGGQVIASSLAGGVAGSILVAGSASTTEGLAPAQQVILIDAGQLLSSALGSGRDAGGAGDIIVVSDTVSISRGAELSATTVDGLAGSVVIEATRLEVNDAGRIATSTSGLADGGDLTLLVDDLTLSSGSIEADSDPNLGRFFFYQRNVQEADASLATTLEPRAVLFASVPPVDLGAPNGPFLFFAELEPTTAGILWATNLQIASVPVDTVPVAPGDAEISGASDGTLPIQLLISGISDSDFAGAHDEAGPVELNFQFLEAGVYEFGDGGTITVTGRDGAAASVVDLSGSGRITSTSSGNAGTIAPAGTELPGLVFELLPGAAGEVQLTSSSLRLTDSALISAGTLDGAGGSVLINANDVVLIDASRVSASSNGSGNAGSVGLSGMSGAATTVLLDGARLESLSTETGNAGSVVIDSEQLVLTDGAQLNVLSLGSGAAGSVEVRGTDLTLTSGSALLASVNDNAGGSVNILIDGSLNLSDSRITASAQGLDLGDSGGNILVSAPVSVTLNDSQIQADANAGAGGNIDIATRTIVTSAYSAVSATSQSNVDGQIEIDAVNQITGVLITTESPELAQPAPIRQRCAAADLVNRSSLVVRSVPEDAVRSPYLNGQGEKSVVGACRPEASAR